MTRYINKADVVSEIERRRDESWLGMYTKEKGIIFDITDYILSFLDTIEVKEIDLDEEFDNNISFPADVDEAAKEYASIQLGNEYDEYFSVDINILEAFKAGAEWMAKQGETLYDTINVDGKNQRWLGENLLHGDYDAGQAVIVQIRKK